MRVSFRFLSLLVISSLLVLVRPGDSLAGTCEKAIARMVSVQGIVQVKRVGDTQWQQVKLNETYCPGDIIQVGERSRADVALINQPVLRLDQNTVITLGGLKEDRTSIIALIKGAAHFFSRVTRGLEVQTAFVNAGVEGTEFFIRVEKDKTVLSVFEGKVLASNAAGSLAITGGQSAVAEAGKTPVERVVVHARDAVRWALYYPPVVYEHPENFKENDPRFYTSRASSLLQVGRVDEAKVDLGKALELDPNNSVALALQSIIAVTQNEKEKALELAGKAVQSNPNSAEARIALSYARQANFNLEGALNSVEEAVRVQPENALAWARLAELRLSFGKLKEALSAAQKAVTLNPDVSRTQTVLGFAYLTEIRIKESQKAFERAIELDQADPLPRLGLGLSKIREGELNEGGREIEIAASLDPNNSLIRSYLGKTFFEEKRTRKSSEEYDIAKQLDPADPTPFFYDAILKQTTNRPVEALHDVQEAIELNDNRAVYRSRLLLDADLAARSAGLARIYTDLGFQQLALVEGWDSVNTDPADFSGHRFLADTYAALPRHEIARVSELLQSQLLQPINITPIQPQLAESNLFVISGGGPADLSFNEFNPFFNRNRLALQLNGIAGSDNTVGEEVVASGIYNNASFSVGQFYYRTDGFRINDDLKDTIDNAFIQYSLSPETSIQGEFRYRDTKKGDLTLRFLPDDFYPKQRQERETNSVRLGFRHSFSPGSDLIGTVMYQDLDASYHDSPDPIFVALDSKTDQRAYGGELQHLFGSNYIKTVAGAGYFSIDGDTQENDEFLFFLLDPTMPPVPTISTAKTDIDVKHGNLYVYSYISALKNVTATIGVSGDFLESDLGDKNQFNPKVGVTWNPVPDTTLRAAYFRVLKRTLITDQTLEPTQVAGFNQFFDDQESTDAWSGGVAVDQKFTKNIYGGAEYSGRDLTVPFPRTFVDPVTGIAESEVRHVDWNERLGRAYLYWTPHNWLALTAEYQYEKFERGEEFTGIDRIKEVKTHRVPLGINFYHPSGLAAMLKATYYNQEGEFQPQGAAGFDPFTGNPIFIHGKDSFWLFDAAISYRLPKRVGFITVGAKNLFDTSFKFADTDPFNPVIQPRRFLFARATLSF
jgi:tetratricopeptide (TPR) repeat protein/opacity protein-like surface antigen